MSPLCIIVLAEMPPQRGFVAFGLCICKYYYIVSVTIFVHTYYVALLECDISSWLDKRIVDNGCGYIDLMIIILA